MDDATREKLIRVEGAKGLVVQFAKCCNPMPGHPVAGYATKSAGITIHRRDCKTFTSASRDPKRIIEASWEGERQFETAMRVILGQRPNVLADITNAIRPMNIDITKANYRPGDNGESCFEFVFQAPEKGYVERVARTLRTVSGVRDVATIPVKQLARTR